MPDQVRINNSMYSWASIEVKVDGDIFHGFTSIGYEDSRERVHAYGMGRAHAPRGRTSGKYTPGPASLSGPKSSVRALLKKLAEAGTGKKTSFGDTVFQIVVQYNEPDEVPITDELVDCVVTKVGASHEEGPDPLEEELELHVMKIVRDGRTLHREES